ncbi:MAG: Gfo/Idh/MocA family oxidoreductase [Opitutales bacterium]|nr:Gfo/Idh/MocA family oxidoreductase [Opitutales bacterium]
MIVGGGRRFQTIYQPILNDISEWMIPIAVYDPILQTAKSRADEIGCLGSDDLPELLKIKDFDAALICTPIPTHFGLTAYLLEHGIHCHTETQWCSTIDQAKKLCELAKKNALVSNVAEMFPYMPADRFAQALRKRGDIGQIGRIFSYGSNANYHNCARWVSWARRAPDTVRAIQHSAPDGQGRGDSDIFMSREFYWDDGLMIVDQRAGINGSRGRTGRPGYEEWHGTHGTLRHAPAPSRDFDGNMAIYGLIHEGQRFDGLPVEKILRRGNWESSQCLLPRGVLSVKNQHPTRTKTGWAHCQYWYTAAVIAHLYDFASAVQNNSEPQMGAELSLATVEMQIASLISIENGGATISLCDLDTEAYDNAIINEIQEQYNYHPDDIEAVVNPKPKNLK